MPSNRPVDVLRFVRRPFKAMIPGIKSKSRSLHKKQENFQDSFVDFESLHVRAPHIRSVFIGLLTCKGQVSLESGVMNGSGRAGVSRICFISFWGKYHD